METVAVVLEKPQQLSLRKLVLAEAEPDDAVVDVDWTGISSGTERLLWSGRMPPFPGMGYPLVPGYETVGRIARAPRGSGLHEGDPVFVPGANCYGDIKGLFGGAASRVVVAARKLVPLPEGAGETGILVALAATAHHAAASDGARLPELIVGHGIVGRLIARLTLALGGEAPVVWERNPLRHTGAEGYQVTRAEADPRRNYTSICDASGDSAILDLLVTRLAKRGEITLAGFYETPLSFTFPPAFMREARLRIAAEWSSDDLAAVRQLMAEKRLNLDGLITHRAPASDAAPAYETAFTDPHCLKMVLDWSSPS